MNFNQKVQPGNEANTLTISGRGALELIAPKAEATVKIELTQDQWDHVIYHLELCIYPIVQWDDSIDVMRKRAHDCIKVNTKELLHRLVAGTQNEWLANRLNGVVDE